MTARATTLMNAFANICVQEGDGTAWARLDALVANVQTFGLVLPEEGQRIVEEGICNGLLCHRGVIVSNNPKVWLDEAGALAMANGLDHDFAQDATEVQPEPAPEEALCPRCEDSHPLEDLGDGGLCSDCGVDLQEEEANREFEAHVARAERAALLPLKTIHEARLHNLLGRVECLEKEAQTLRAAAAVAAADSTLVWTFLEGLHSSLLGLLDAKEETR
jgi:hypothetical protein